MTKVVRTAYSAVTDKVAHNSR